jgi:hypothetical protein
VTSKNEDQSSIDKIEEAKVLYERYIELARIAEVPAPDELTIDRQDPGPQETWVSDSPIGSAPAISTLIR